MAKLTDKLKNNYNVAKWLCFIVFIITFVYSEWTRGGSVIRMINTSSPTLTPFWLYNGLLCVILGAFSLLVLYFAVRLFRNVGKFFVLPVAETYLLTVIAFSGAHLIAGTLRLSLLITPTAYIWCHYLSGLISGFPALLWLNAMLRKRYLTPQSARYVFLWSMMTFLISNMALTLYGGSII